MHFIITIMYRERDLPMKTIKVNGRVDRKGHLRLDVPTEYASCDVEVVMVIEKKTESRKKYDFSDLSGRLIWKGNAVEAQRSLRDEWE